MHAVEDTELCSPLLWIRALESDTEVASFAPKAAGVRIVVAERAAGELASLARNPDRGAAVVIIESGVRGFELLCARLRAMSPRPRVIVVYPKTRVFSNARLLPDLASGF